MVTETSSEYPTISVIIPCYNRQATILETLNSVIMQKYPAHEIIVVDDGSTDQTGEIIASKFTSSVVKYIYQENAGAASARNTGLENSQGEWVAFLDSDDQWTKNKLLDDVKVITANTDIDFIHGNRVQKYPSGQTDKGRLHKPISDFRSKEYLLAAWCMKTSTVLIKTKLLESLDHYFMPALKTCEDYELFWRAILSSKKIGYVEDANVLINLTQDGASRNQNYEILVKDNLTAISNALIWARAISSDNIYVNTLKYKKSLEILRLLNHNFGKGDLINAISNLWYFKNSILYFLYFKIKSLSNIKIN